MMILLLFLLLLIIHADRKSTNHFDLVSKDFIYPYHSANRWVLELTEWVNVCVCLYAFKLHKLVNHNYKWPMVPTVSLLFAFDTWHRLHTINDYIFCSYFKFSLHFYLFFFLFLSFFLSLSISSSNVSMWISIIVFFQ